MCSVQRLFRDIYRHGRRHPHEVLVPVIVPLVLTGVFQRLLAMVGVHAYGLYTASGKGMLGNVVKDGLVGLLKLVRELVL